MNSDGKKISFGFSKLSKKPSILAPPKKSETVELIDCLEGTEIKVKNAIEKVEEVPLVIPIKGDPKKIISNIERAKNKKINNETSEEDSRPDSELTIAELAARQLLKEARNKLTQKGDTTKVHTLLLKENSTVQDGIEPSMDDYENVPIEDFGLAVLRGIGWKEEKADQSKPVPRLRPKGLGLGGQKIVDVNTEKVFDKNSEQLVLKEGAFGKIIGGPHKGEFCEVQFCDQWTGRVEVKISKTNEIVTLNELFVALITKEDYIRGSKVINNAKYEKYKEMGEIQDYSNKDSLLDKTKTALSTSEDSVHSGSDDSYLEKVKSVSKLKSEYKVKKEIVSSNDEVSDEKHEKEKSRARDNNSSSGSKYKYNGRGHTKSSHDENIRKRSGQHYTNRYRDSSEDYKREKPTPKKKYDSREHSKEYTERAYGRSESKLDKKNNERKSKSEFRRSRSRDSLVKNDKKKSYVKKSSSADHRRTQSHKKSRSRSSSREYAQNNKNKKHLKKKRTEQNSNSDEESSCDESHKSKFSKSEKPRRKSYSSSESDYERQNSSKDKRRVRADTYKLKQ